MSINFVSGGLLVILPRDQAAGYCAELEQQDGRPAWIIGSVEHGSRKATIVDQPTVLEVPEVERDFELW